MMEQIKLKNSAFNDIYNKSYRLAAAVFAISNVMSKEEELRTKIRKVALDFMSASVSLKDIKLQDPRNFISEVEKVALLLMSMLEIASIAGLISEMNAGIVGKEFESFLSELSKFSSAFETGDIGSVKNIFDSDNRPDSTRKYIEKESLQIPEPFLNEDPEVAFYDKKILKPRVGEGGNGNNRKDVRRNNILNFIKGHNNVGIKDIVPNIISCSEKNVQRGLINIVNTGLIKKIGERRWSKYSVA